MSLTRDEAALAFAEAMGWVFDPSSRRVTYRADSVLCLFLIPRADAPLHEHLAFVGRVAESLRAADHRMSNLSVVSHFNLKRMDGTGPAPDVFEIAICVDGASELGDVEEIEAFASDLSWAALLAGAEAAKAGRS